MQAFIDFLVNNYLWFLVISLILVFALIGYLVDTNEKKDKEDIPEEKNEEQTNEVNMNQDEESTEILEFDEKEK